MVCALLLAAMRPLSAEDSLPRRIVVLAIPTHVKFVENDSRELPDGSLWIAGKYSVGLERIRMIAGDGEVPRKLRVTLSASHFGTIASEPLISVVLEVEGGKLKAVYWGAVIHSTCLPRELIDDASPVNGVYSSMVGDDKCLKFDETRASR
jgi:hypothetical protein